MPPLTCDIILSMAYYALCHNDLFFSCLLALGFFTLLRAGELLNLRGQGLLVNASQLVVSLKDTKTGKRNAADEMVTTDVQFAVLMATTVRDVLVSQNALHKKLWEFSAQAFTATFGNSNSKRWGFAHTPCVGVVQRGWCSRQAARK